MLRLKIGITLTLIVVGFNVNIGYSADSSRGRELARQCSVCHGKLGIANDPEVPNLAGQSSFYTEKSLNDYQSGKREDRRMSLLVKNLTSTDIKDLAAWFESLKVSVSEPD